MITTVVQLNDQLPLSCSRKGTCCYGNSVFLNPWEIAVLANKKDCTSFEFIKMFTIERGLRLRFDGQKNELGKSVCNLYDNKIGCSIHEVRPLACRLFPLGRQIQNNKVSYIFQGKQFPCLSECREVIQLPHLKVNEYLVAQETKLFEIAQDEYLEVMQNLADIAFALLLDTGLSESGDTHTLQEWRKMKFENADQLNKRISNDWYQVLMLPEIKLERFNPISFIFQHNELLQAKAQLQFEYFETFSDFSKASVETMAITLFLAKSIGANTTTLIDLWIEIAKRNGALG